MKIQKVMFMSWDKKLKRLQENLNLTAEGLASTLGITTRTLYDFMKPESDGGREPTGPVKKLIDLLSGELDSQGVGKKPQLNLVVIHGDFRVREQEDAVSAVLDMHAAAGSQRNNEFHYVTVEPERDKKWALEGLMKRRIQPHFFVTEQGLDNQGSKDCYFTTTTVWLAAQAMRRDLAHITLAADPAKFWPLAKELRELAEVDVTFVRETAVELKPEMVALLDGIGIKVADPLGRKFGVITSLRRTPDQTGKITYGFIEQGRSKLFFSWNHMRKENGHPEIGIDELFVGDRVSFSIGINNEGACATDVALVERANNAPSVTKFEPLPIVSRSNTTAVEADLIDILRDAVVDCEDKDGWALLSDVGNRANVRARASFKERLQATTGKKIYDFCEAHPDIFDSRAHTPGSKEASAKVRLKPQKNPKRPN